MKAAGVLHWVKANRWAVALVAVVIVGYSVGKDAALRDNARDLAQLSHDHAG